LYISIIGGCHDCHTEGYTESGGTIDPAKALKGIAVGWMGPWGTTYASNLRTEVRFMSEDGFVGLAKYKGQPPMPWYNLRAMDESDIRSLYRYIKSLSDPGEPVPNNLGPGQEPKTPYVVIAPPTMPKP
jgi:mono/diheme cytochrome c family protein